MSKYIDAVIGLVVVLALAFGGYKLYRSGGASERATTAAAVVEQSAQAAATTQGYQANVDQANATVRDQERTSATRAAGLRATEQRMRDLAAARDLANATAAALSEYAADLDRDLEDCREQYVALGEVAAGASTAAHGLYDAWPGQAEWADAQAAFMKQAQDFIK